MARQPKLKERVTILEERLKLFEPLPEHKLALADSAAELRCAREQSERLQRFALIVAVASAAFWLALDVFLVLR
jgi:hypothetical protein